MQEQDFKEIRHSLGKTQKEMAQLLSVSLKAVHSYEQGWRRVPAAVERQMYFLLCRKMSATHHAKPCWKIRKCSAATKRQCPAWEFRTGELCWFINGNLCNGQAHKDWREKMAICRSCEVFRSQLSL
jgi:DNA-binding XRE family transcriptional regulator